MAKPSKDRILEALLERHGKTYAAELGIDLERNTPSVLYRWLCAATLLSARIGADIAMQAARALADQGWTTAQKMADSTWEQRTRTLNEAGYARYDESTSRMLGDTAQMLLDKYGGDLRRLREAARRDPGRERALLKECKGIGDVGADIFCREAQVAWDELFPFAGRWTRPGGSGWRTPPTGSPSAYRVRTTHASSPPWFAHVSPTTSIRCWRRRAVERLTRLRSGGRHETHQRSPAGRADSGALQQGRAKHLASARLVRPAAR